MTTKIFFINNISLKLDKSNLRLNLNLLSVFMKMEA